ncbi:hypothetical protein PHISCL_00691 [Aspergillus sclerotialis]|uniref:Arrestin-like N-terminal domain-containing protein n=1 Tax=Aspergillus sclerotialis TaxID=2070753 RepID=A0A3A2ZWA5_9EURO|nr:hypothetical protein PHISCL_00691 [Aspergillus sclerotialis]
MESLTKFSRPKVSIDLVGKGPSPILTYTTWDRIEGTVSIEVDHDTRFDDVEIAFEAHEDCVTGTAKTSVDRSAVPGTSEAYQTLLKLRQPIDSSEYPSPRVFERGKIYRFPFTFVVPDRLLPQICRHNKCNAQVEHAHTQLPPSLGDPMLASDGKTLLDDMSSEMCRISYIVRVTVRKVSPGNKSPRSLVSVGKKLRIIPAVEEDPPLDIAENDKAYWDRKTKDVRKGFMRGSLGRIEMFSSQPKPIELLPRAYEMGDSVRTVVTLQLRFYPIGNEKPPILSKLSSKLRVSTVYSNNPLETIPSGSPMSFSQLGQATYLETVPLSARCVESARWVKHTEPSRDSIASTSSIESCASSIHTGKTYYATSIVVPITLPKNKAFVPTFHSCIISRFYGLDLDVSYRTSATINPSISLRLPVQFTCHRKVDRGIYPPAQGEVKDEIDEFFCPRTIAPPSSEFTARARLPRVTGVCQ